MMTLGVGVMNRLWPHSISRAKSSIRFLLSPLRSRIQKIRWESTIAKYPPQIKNRSFPWKSKTQIHPGPNGVNGASATMKKRLEKQWWTGKDWLTYSTHKLSRDTADAQIWKNCHDPGTFICCFYLKENTCDRNYSFSKYRTLNLISELYSLARPEWASPQ